MKTYLKTIALLLVTLLIGIGIGFQISEVLVNKKFETMQNYLKPDGFVEFYDEVIKPDAKQKEEIKPILLKYHEQISTSLISGFGKVDSLKTSLRNELAPLLSKEQIKRFDDMMKEHKK